MTIETEAHAKGARELVRRLQNSLSLSSRYMDTESYSLLEGQLTREIQKIRNAIASFDQSRTREIPTKEWVTISLSPENADTNSDFSRFKVETSVITVPLRQAAQILNEKPANPAGFLFNHL